MVTGRRTFVGKQSMWLIKADETEIERLRQLYLASTRRNQTGGSANP